MIGKIALVGAGLGDPELLTIKGLRKIEQADVVVYDRLINPAILNACKADCEKIYVGKKPNYHPVPQDKIEEIMIEKARQGLNIVRLKSGDPYVFGRGGEEGSALKEAGIAFEVIPGITSSIGGLTYAGIPITHRNLSASFHVYTGHLNDSSQAIDWSIAARTEGTLVFLMGMSGLQEITKKLMSNGKDKNTPVAIIQWASRKQQKTVVGTLETIFKQAQAAELEPPSLIVIGQVVKCREELNFFEERPFFSTSITIPFTKKKGIASRLTDLGAEIIELPPSCKQISEGIIDFSKAQQVVFTDQLSIEMFVRLMKQNKIDWRNLSDWRFITVGHHTGSTLEKKGILADHNYLDLTVCLQELEITSTTLFLGDSSTIDILKEEKIAGTKLISHEEKIVVEIPRLWQKTDLMYFPNSKSARLFLTALNNKELEIVKQKKIIVMGQKTKDVFNYYKIPVILTDEPSYESVVEKIKEEME
ncbi:MULTISPECIES: uroporphyrinogen-III C-methyltransferase [Enterococcus]|uniref:uroporphyrinogen-III C-methyltransferase n=1 Tax=Candidatus Enterococcus murrayae TaxID=2815321 RepID=A0ABS3HGP8_9ENTE|nr:uroporphyrinogen-III C-methyltransferase [Enterococcus sp. MJM16]MBO0452144.1 uroporphyrinogen-III C-methyltransferase [Enterococcus sp. MJM16]